MQNPKTFNLLINVLGAAVGVIVVGYVAYSMIRSRAETACSSRYPAPTRFSLKTSDGAPLTPIQLQARAGAGERGLLENATVVSDSGSPTGEALDVQLRQAGYAVKGKPAAFGGVSFRWSPPGIGAASAACLTYSVWLPEGFAYGEGGVLPGIFGGPVTGTVAGPGAVTPRVSTHIAWGPEGTAALQVTSDIPEFSMSAGPSFRLQPGQWIKLEQEIVLNTAGQTDGVVRLWADGGLVFEARGQALRGDAKTAVSGVLAEIQYTRPPAKPGVLRVSPFEMGWR